MKLSTQASSQIEEIKTALRHVGSEGATKGEIRKAIRVEIPHRTLQRRLAYMRNTGIVFTSGDSRSTRYHLADVETTVIAIPESALPLTDESKRLLALVSRPRTQRTPTGYNREFLELYQPNETNYLSPADLEQLTQWGQTLDSNQPAGTYAREILQRLLIDLSYNSSRLEGNTRIYNYQKEGVIASETSAISSQICAYHWGYAACLHEIATPKG